MRAGGRAGWRNHAKPPEKVLLLLLLLLSLLCPLLLFLVFCSAGLFGPYLERARVIRAREGQAPKNRAPGTPKGREHAKGGYIAKA